MQMINQVLLFGVKNEVGVAKLYYMKENDISKF